MGIGDKVCSDFNSNVIKDTPNQPGIKQKPSGSVHVLALTKICFCTWFRCFLGVFGAFQSVLGDFKYFLLAQAAVFGLFFYFSAFLKFKKN